MSINDENIKVDVGYDLSTGCVNLMFVGQGHIKLEPTDARKIGEALIKGADAVEKHRAN